MKFLDEYRDPPRVRQLVQEIRRRATRRWTLMEVCGGQTHSLLRHGIVEELSDVVELIHGPGCPVCVTSVGSIDQAIHLAQQPHTTVATFGDMLRVPGSRESLALARARGASVRIVYSPLDAVALAQRTPGERVVFFAVGFETTAPATALAVKQAAQQGLVNFRVLVSHVRVQPAMEALLAQPDRRIDGFLAAGHVCTITGYESYEGLVEQYSLPVVVTGFEPVDLLAGIRECIEQLETRRPEVANRYARIVRKQGNATALALMDEVFEHCDQEWRGFGILPGGGLKLRAAWHRYDARAAGGEMPLTVVDTSACQSGLVLSGRIKPHQCSAFARECTPDSPLGAPMVSSEGACAAYFRYRGPVTHNSPEAQ